MGEHKYNKQCNQCGHCCRVIVNIIPMSEAAAVWATARGYTMLDSSDEFLCIEIPSVCPQLTEDNKCKLQDNKPLTCQQYPMFLKEEEITKLGIKKSRMLGQTCGFK
jgi:Fe-S-cluster containining protein